MNIYILLNSTHSSFKLGIPNTNKKPSLSGIGISGLKVLTNANTSYNTECDWVAAAWLLVRTGAQALSELTYNVNNVKKINL